MPISRRGLLLGGAATALALGLPAAAQGAPTAAQFLALSERLTGVPGLDGEVAGRLLDGLLATGKGDAVAALVGGGTDAASQALGNAIVGSWYSGMYEGPGGPAVATYDQALMWSALTFTKPGGQCGGDTGYWAEPA